jgi:hypothetical protein
MTDLSTFTRKWFGAISGLAAQIALKSFTHLFAAFKSDFCCSLLLCCSFAAATELQFTHSAAAELQFKHFVAITCIFVASCA